MSVKIRQRFHVTFGIGVEDGQRFEGEREEVDKNEAATMEVVADGG
jgi:hypothetical protein